MIIAYIRAIMSVYSMLIHFAIAATDTVLINLYWHLHISIPTFVGILHAAKQVLDNVKRYQDITNTLVIVKTLFSLSLNKTQLIRAIQVCANGAYIPN